MEPRILGTDLNVPALGLGCMGFSHAYGAPMERTEAVRLIQQAADMGYAFFDTAEAYGTVDNPHHNEELVGAALRSRRDVKTRNKWTALILLGALVLSLLAGCAGTPANDGTPAATPEGPQDEIPQEPEMKPEPVTGPATEPESESKDGGVLIAYYSATGSTEAVAGYIANATDGDTFAITPAEPYTSDDLNWRDNSSRVSREHDDASLRVMELSETAVDGWENYDTVFIG